ncbi:MAG: hypothetical protein JSR72_05870 [Proteobacteria bacterium]|nr:hypothetical protein [Pseudomonadota bacterium]
MKYAIPVIALLLAAGGTAQAKLTPFDGARESNVPVASVTSASVTSNETSTASTAEQNYFRAPQADESARPGRCSVSTFVFTKIRLAQACY